MSEGRRPIDILEPYEARRLMEAASPRSFLGCRARVLVCLCWRAGLRVSSAAALRPCDLQLERHLLRADASRAEGKRDYCPALDDLVVQEIERFLPLRARMLGGPAETLPLVCTRHGTPMAPQLIRRLISALARKAGFGDRRVNPRNLRHSLAYELLQGGFPIDLIAAQFGSTNDVQMKVYLGRLERQVAAARMRRWKAQGEEPTYRQCAFMRRDELRPVLADDTAWGINPVRQLQRVRDIANRHFD